MGRTLLLTTLVVVSLVISVSGQIPPFINYQGVLTDGAGVPVSDGSYSITFNLYHNETGGSPVWTQTSPVSVTGGIFNVSLGAVPAEFFEMPVFLGLSIEGGPELSPRRLFLTSPYAMNSVTVQDDAINEFKIADGTVVRSLNGVTENVNLLPGSNVTITPSGQDITIAATGGGGVGGSGTAGQVAFWSDPTTLTGVNELFWDNANKRLGIGTPNPNARLRVESADQYTAVIASNYGGTDAQVLRVNYTGTGTYHPIAIFAQSKPSDNIGIGGDFVGGEIGLRAVANIGNQYSSSFAYGIHAQAIGNESGNTSIRYGVFAEASGPGTTQCYAVLGDAQGASATYSIGVAGVSSNGSNERNGVYGYSSPGGTSYFGVYGEAAVSGASAAVYADGDLQYTGSLIGPPSDERLKMDIQPYQGALASIQQIEPKTFKYKTDDPLYKDINMSPGVHYGLIAQELETVLPELVVERIHPKGPNSGVDHPVPPLKVKGIKYLELIPVLVQAIKEQQETIEALQTRVAELEKK